MRIPVGVRALSQLSLLRGSRKLHGASRKRADQRVSRVFRPIHVSSRKWKLLFELVPEPGEDFAGVSWVALDGRFAPPDLEGGRWVHLDEFTLQARPVDKTLFQASLDQGESKRRTAEEIGRD